MNTGAASHGDSVWRNVHDYPRRFSCRDSPIRLKGVFRGTEGKRMGIVRLLLEARREKRSVALDFSAVVLVKYTCHRAGGRVSGGLSGARHSSGTDWERQATS